MIDNRKVRQVLRERLLTVTGSVPIAWEGRALDVDSTAFIREKLIPTTERIVATQLVEGLGYVQYDITVPKGEGTEEAEDLAKSIKDVFKPTLSLVSQSIEVAIDRVEPGNSFDVDSRWTVFPVRVYWRTYVSNP